MGRKRATGVSWIGLLVGLTGCVAGSGDTGGFPADGESGDVNGVVFKGPMVAGSAVTLEPLGPDGALAGDVFTVSVADASGAYDITGVPRGLVRVVAEGETLNEAEGAVDARPLRMVAYAEVGGPAQPIHVNLLTDLTHLRVERLLGDGLAPPDAIRQAQDELRAALTIGVGGLPESAGEGVDPYGEGFDASWLFAFSGVIAQVGADRERAGDGVLSELIDAIREDLADDGRVEEPLRTAVYLGEETFNPDLATLSLDTHSVDYALAVVLPDPHPALDSDHDGTVNSEDNCRYVANADQADAAGLGFGEACDYRLDAIATTPEWGCAVLREGGGIRCWSVLAEPIGGRPPRADQFPVPPEAPWGASEGLAGEGYRAVALGDGVACGILGGDVSCWEDGVGTSVVIDGGWTDVAVSAGLVCAKDDAGALACVNRATSYRVDLPGSFTDFALLGDGLVCAIATDGSLGCYDGSGAAADLPDLPTGAYTRLAASSAGSGWACAISATDGTLACFGSSPLVAMAPTTGSYVDVVVSEGVACGFTAAGAPDCWQDEATCPPVGEAPPAVTDVVASGCQLCGIDPMGLGACWPLEWDVEHPPPE